ncbi:hypothetical protein HZY91_09540 [Facklamia sp. DSM 111018]|uniref:Uncharacterized protein n=1 Tax=Facklamia lactis TaxID=2749967 RepID=A0ABS0LSG9_9LACT|nr:hypothetical protein [Facklamia lactis]MBG9981414.1 hypothetical protein [Facklamia lactis]MBG9987110.1 hypothetical protein [Facklamia lactis]
MKKISVFLVALCVLIGSQPISILAEEQVVESNWSSILKELEPSDKTTEELLREAPDYSGEPTFNPQLQAFIDKLKENSNAETVQNIYSHTFVFERMTPDLTSEEIEALNSVRELCFFIQTNNEGIEGKTQSNWVEMIESSDHLASSDPDFYELISQVALNNGMALEAYVYNNFIQEGPIITMTVNQYLEKAVPFAEYQYNLETQEVTQTNRPDIALTPYNFSILYGIEVENNYPYQAIPSSFEIPVLRNSPQNQNTPSADEESDLADEEDDFTPEKAFKAIMDKEGYNPEDIKMEMNEYIETEDSYLIVLSSVSLKKNGGSGTVAKYMVDRELNVTMQ